MKLNAYWKKHLFSNVPSSLFGFREKHLFSNVPSFLFGFRENRLMNSFGKEKQTYAVMDKEARQQFQFLFLMQLRDLNERNAN